MTTSSSALQWKAHAVTSLILLSSTRVWGSNTDSAASGQCEFANEPRVGYFWDPACRMGWLGCNADGKHAECRFCGGSAFVPCPGAEPPRPEREVSPESPRPEHAVSPVPPRPEHAESPVPPRPEFEVSTVPPRTELAVSPVPSRPGRAVSPVLPKEGLRGICYAPLPCLGSACGAPENMAQEGYRSQWGAEGRDDLGIMKRMGANAIRLYHPIGELDPQPDSRGFLDASEAAGLKVFGAVHQYLHCDEHDDCYEAWFKAVHDGLANGFTKDGAWHSAVWAINLINEVDAHVPFTDGARQVKRLISAADALLAAEQAAHVPGTVNLTSCFTAAMAQPLGGGDWLVSHGFHSMDAWIKTPSLVEYTPRSAASLADLAKAIDQRWIHCVNAQGNVYGWIAGEQWSRPWIIGELGYGPVHSDVVEKELKELNKATLEDPWFLGFFLFQFQTAYFKWGSELNFGMFGVGSPEVATASHRGKSFPVHCLTTRQWAFEQAGDGCKDKCNHRSHAVARAFGGEISGRGVCHEEPPLSQKSAGTKRRRLLHNTSEINDFYV